MSWIFLSALDTIVEFEMQPTVATDKGKTFCSFSVWLIVRGCKSDDEAKERWSAALKFIRGFLVAASEQLDSTDS